MANSSDTLGMTAAAETNCLSRLWWLWLPLAGALALLVAAHLYSDKYVAWVAGEIGVLEILHVLIPLASFILALRLLVMSQVRRSRWMQVWVLLAVFGSFYVTGEEASWGQHFLGWGTPETWQEVNDQGETNLHNTSSWLDQKPRAMLEIGVIVGGILIPLIALFRPDIRRSRLAIILPPLICLPSALIAEFARMWERLVTDAGNGIQLFHRASEVQETYFYLFILLYLIVLRHRLIGRTD